MRAHPQYLVLMGQKETREQLGLNILKQEELQPQIQISSLVAGTQPQVRYTMMMFQLNLLPFPPSSPL